MTAPQRDPWWIFPIIIAVALGIPAVAMNVALWMSR